MMNRREFFGLLGVSILITPVLASKQANVIVAGNNDYMKWANIHVEAGNSCLIVSEEMWNDICNPNGVTLKR